MTQGQDPNQKIVKSTEDTRQGTNKPRNMPIVLLVSTIGAFAACLVVYLFFVG